MLLNPPTTLPISIKEARKLLGVSAAGLSDDQIAELVICLTEVADNFLQDLGSTNYNGV